MTEEWISLLNKTPDKKAWYPTLHCWDIREGFFPGAAFWDGDRFINNDFMGDPPIACWINKIYTNQKLANDSAWENDPNW